MPAILMYRLQSVYSATTAFAALHGSANGTDRLIAAVHHSVRC